MAYRLAGATICSITLAANPSVVVADPQSRAEVAATYLVETIERHPGLVIAHRNQDGPWHYVERGTTLVGSGRQVDQHTIFEIGSITKVFTSILLADMILNGEVDLSDSITKYLPDGPWPEPLYDITLLHLSTHTSGLPRRPNNLLPEGSRGPYEDYSRERIIEMLRTVVLDYPPGTDFSYSNVAVGLLGMLLSDAADQPLEKLFEEQIFRPIGMHSTGLRPRPGIDIATPHDATGNEPVAFWSFGVLAAAGGLYSTAQDMSLFADTLLRRRNNAISDAALLTIESDFAIPGGDHNALLGWVRPDEIDGHVLFNHDGGTGGSRAIFAVEPLSNDATIILSNAATSIMEYAWYVHVPGRDLPERQKLRQINLETSDAALMIGSYLLPDADVIKISRESSQLFSEIGDGDMHPVYPYGKDRLFYRVGEAQLIFDFGAADKFAAGVTLITPGSSVRGHRVRNKQPAK